MAEKQLSPQEYKLKKERQEKEAYAILNAQTLKDMSNREAFLDLLDKVALHISSSISNTILVQAQKPEATAVLPMQEWEKRNLSIITDNNGYYPKGIYQFVRDGYYTDDKGEIHDKFKVVKGFDASQTTDVKYARSIVNEAQPIKVFLNSPNATVSRNVALVNSSPIRCLAYDKNKLISDDEDIPEGVRYIGSTKTVIVRQLAVDTWFQRVAYEIAQGIYHKLEGSAYNRASKSFEAGVTAYLLCRMADVSVEPIQFNDFSNLKNKYSPEEFRRILERCYDNAHDMAYRLNNKLRENNKPKTSPIRSEVVIS